MNFVSIATHLPEWDIDELSRAIRCHYLSSTGLSPGTADVDIAPRLEASLPESVSKDIERAAFFNIAIGHF